MSYQVLARKWRPKDFSQLMGQEHVVDVLFNALEQNRLHHAYLFTGTRGVGKTTIARIFAKSLNCEQGITATPCGKCQTCLDIDDGRYIDLLEIDAASKTKVDDTREILDNVQYAPSRGRFKVYLIDEVHMLSRSSFNALLKTLEEPPEHVKFILATTDPQKLPITVLSRCLQFHLKALTVEQIKQQLSHILSAENVTVEALALNLLAKSARGSMRDCLSLTDQAIAQGRGNITFANVQKMLGGVDHQWAFNILINLIKQDGQGLMALSQNITTFAPNYAQVLAQLIQLLHQVALAQVVGNHFEFTPEQSELFDRFCQLMSPEDVQLYYQIAVQGRKDLNLSLDEQAGFDMVLLRMLAFQPMARPKNQVVNQHIESTQARNSDIDALMPLEQKQASQSQSDVLTPPPVEQLSTAPASTPEPAESPEPAKSPELTSTIEPGKSPAFEKTLEPVNPENAQDTVEPVQEQKATPADITNELLESSDVDHEQANTLAALNNEQEVILAQAHSQGFEQEVIAPEPGQVENAQTETIKEEPVAISHEQALTLPADELAQGPESTVDAPLQQVTSPAVIATPVEHSPALNDVTSEILATRNMLRSRKKGLDKPSKKLDDAKERQTLVPAKTIDDIEDNKLPQAPYQPEQIDPSVIKKANQVDKWAFMIDAMGLNGRIRQLAINAVISERSDDDNLYLSLDENTKHLQSENAHEQLQNFISQYLKKPIAVHIEVIGQTKVAPFNIQSDINEKRLDYAKELIANDDVVRHLQTEFQAQLDEASIEAR